MTVKLGDARVVRARRALERSLTGTRAGEAVLELSSTARDYGGGGEIGSAQVRARVNGDVGVEIRSNPGAETK